MTRVCKTKPQKLLLNTQPQMTAAKLFSARSQKSYQSTKTLSTTYPNPSQIPKSTQTHSLMGTVSTQNKLTWLLLTLTFE